MRLSTPATLTVGFYSPLLPGTYRTVITVKWDTGSLDIPVTVSVPGSADFPPIVSAVLNAASQLSGPIAPGEIISVFGTGLDTVQINGQPAQLPPSSAPPNSG